MRQKVEGIGGVFFRARDPETLSKWYEETLGLDVVQPPWMQQPGPTVIAPFAEDSEYFGRASQQWMINFRVEDLNAMIAQLEGDGIAVETNAEWDSFVGRFARIHDPEGNPIELWEPAKDLV